MVGIEAAARELRYDFFRHLARENRVSKVATAHTLDDQAETVLLRILRGTGIRGLSGIHPRLPLSKQEGPETSHGSSKSFARCFPSAAPSYGTFSARKAKRGAKTRPIATWVFSAIACGIGFCLC